MAAIDVERYHHRQRAPLCWLLYAAGIWIGTSAYVVRQQEPIVAAVLIVSAIVTLVASANFHWLLVSDQGDALSVRFGPLPIFRRQVIYDEITAFRAARTTLADGWGIHYSLGHRAWVWNLWGRDCVLIDFRGKRLCLGTDDTAGLLELLEARTGLAPSQNQKA